MTEKELKDRFSQLGGIPRSIFAREQPVVQIDRAISRTTLKKCLLKGTELESKDDVSHVLIHLSSNPPNYETPTIQYASKFIQLRLVKFLLQQEQQELFRFFKASATVAESILTQTQLFEGYAHERLMLGGNFQTRNLRNSDEATLSLKAYKPKLVPSFEIAEPATYYLPTERNFPCVDSWIPEVGFFQMTLSLKHPIKAEGIAEMMAKGIGVGMKKFYFVVPSGVTFTGFKWQSFKNIPAEESTSDRGPKRARKSANAPTQDIAMYLDLIEEYVLAIEFPE